MHLSKILHSIPGRISPTLNFTAVNIVFTKKKKKIEIGFFNPIVIQWNPNIPDETKKRKFTLNESTFHFNEQLIARVLLVDSK